jgi:Fic family protein
MPSLKSSYLDRLQFNSAQLATLRELGEYRGKQILYSKQSPEALESLQETARVESTESSNRIEGIEVPHQRLEDIVLQNSKPKNRSEQEVAGYRDALSLIHESATEMKLSCNVMLQLHKKVYSYMSQPGGKWKRSDNEIIERDTDGTKRTRFKPTPAFQTPTKMAELEEDYKKTIGLGQTDPLIAIPLVILDFLCIHPFSDGNGRVSRLITLLLLYHFDYQVGRYISLERIIEETKEDYYRVLQESSKSWHESKHDVAPWMNYFWIVLLRAYREFEERVGKIKPGKGSKSDQIRKAVLRQTVPFAISDIEKECPWIGRDMIRLVLRELKVEGVITLRGKGRGAKWVNRDPDSTNV